VTLFAIAAVLAGALLGLAAPHAVLLVLTSAVTLAGCIALWWSGRVELLALPFLTLAILALHQAAFLATAVLGTMGRARGECAPAEEAASKPMLASEPAALQDATAEDLATAARELASLGAEMRRAPQEDIARKSA
jgi:hypothetical protein